MSPSPCRTNSYFFNYYLCQIKTDGDKKIYEPIDILTRYSNPPWNVKHVLCQFHLMMQKFDVSVLKKDDRGTIIFQVKNWLTSWVNYCENIIFKVILIVHGIHGST
jgi:hypothetical protein